MPHQKNHSSRPTAQKTVQGIYFSSKERALLPPPPEETLMKEEKKEAGRKKIGRKLIQLGTRELRPGQKDMSIL